MKPRTLFLLCLFIVVLLGVIAFAPIPNNPFTFKRFWKQSGMEKEEDLRRQIIAQRKKRAAKILSEQMEAIEQERMTLMGNRKDSMENSKRLLEQTVDPDQLRETQRDQLEVLEQELKMLMENRKDLMEHSKGLAEQKVDPLQLRETQRQQAQEVKQQTEDLLKRQKDAQIQAREAVDLQAQRMQEQRDRINDLRDSLE